jgi:hypothetical protein
MIWHLVFAALAAYITLLIVYHSILFLAIGWHLMRRSTPEQWKQSVARMALLSCCAVLMYPILKPFFVARSVWRTYQLGRHVREQMRDAPTREIDLTILPDEEQKAFARRLQSGESPMRVAAEAEQRIKEVQEAAK